MNAVFLYALVVRSGRHGMSLPRARTLQAIRQQGDSAYCYLRSIGKRTADRRRPSFRVFAEPRRQRPSGAVGFADKVDDVRWQSFRNLSGDALLLVPPRRLAATDVSDFVRRHGDDGWRELCEHMRRVWPVGCYASTHGHGEPYLHIRFERRIKYALPEEAQPVKPPTRRTRRS